MSTTSRVSVFSADKLGIWASALCVVHCIVTPVLISASAVFAHLIPGEEKTHRTLAVGIAALIAQNAAGVAVIVLANSHDGRGALVLYNYGWQMFFVPYAVLAVPIAAARYVPVISRFSPGSNEM